MNYPCKKCDKDKKEMCTLYRTCLAWRVWYALEWKIATERLKRLYGDT